MTTVIRTVTTAVMNVNCYRCTRFYCPSCCRSCFWECKDACYWGCVCHRCSCYCRWCKAVFRVTLRRTLVGSPCHFRVKKEARVFCRAACHVMKTLFGFHMEDRRVLGIAYLIGRIYCSPILFSSTTLHHRSSAPCSSIGLAFENCGQHGRPTVWPRASPDLTQDADSLH